MTADYSGRNFIKLRESLGFHTVIYPVDKSFLMAPHEKRKGRTRTGELRGLPYMTSALEGGPKKADERNKIS